MTVTHLPMTPVQSQLTLAHLAMTLGWTVPAWLALTPKDSSMASAPRVLALESSSARLWFDWRRQVLAA